MCLAIPGKVLEIKEGEITLDYGFEIRKVNMNLVDDLKVGDYALVSNKIIVTTLSEEKAKKFLEIASPNKP
jgi:hydrogenase expression/formation protein HypC